MKISTVFLLTALLVPGAFCHIWWSIVGKPDVFNPSDKKSPKHLDCQGFTSILKQHQLELCRQYDNLLSTTAIGTLQALSQCQEVFKDRAWNCSVFSDSSTHYLGRFVENCTRETAFLNAIIGAGIAREIARKCKEQEITGCGCDFSVRSRTEGSTTILEGCGDNSDFGIRIAKEFTDKCFDGLCSCCSLAALHNNKVGRMLVKKYAKAECICHGVSGSCSVKTCFKKVPEIEELAIKILQKYDVAKHVRVKQACTENCNTSCLIPVHSTEPPLTEDELAYCEFSPNFCKRDLENGIYGTSGRRCYPDRNDFTGCASLCCGGAVEQKLVKIKDDPNKCCKFVWCCYLDCSKCGTYTEIQYFCK